LHYHLVPVLTLAAAYAVLGRLSLLLTTPPGYETVFWPPAGLAFAGVLIGGPRVWPGIWLGSFITNIGTVFYTTDPTTLLTSAVTPATIGVGAVLQALVGTSLVHRYVGFPNTLTRAKEVGALLALGGPLSCSISATIGVTTLAIGGEIPWEHYVIHWGTWWGGDTFGVLIIAPLLLSWLPKPRAIWQHRRISVALPLIVLGTLALALGGFGYTLAQERERLRLIFEHKGEGWAQTIQNVLDEYLRALQSLKGSSSSSPETGGEGCRSFDLHALESRPGLQALAWTIPTARLQLAPASDDSVPTDSEPYVGNMWALGFDVTSMPGYPEILQQARDIGLPAVSGRVMLGEPPGDQFGQLVFLPLYSPWRAHPTLEERRQSLCGYLVGVFLISDVVKAYLPRLDESGVLLRVEDELAPADQGMLFDGQGPSTGRAPRSTDRASGEQSARMQWETTVTLAGRPWRLYFAPTPGYLNARQSFQPWVALAGGLTFTSILGAFLLIITGRAIIIERLIDERTTQLEVSQKLEAAAKQRRREAEVLADLARTINAALDIGTVLQRVADGARELCKSDEAAIALREVGAEVAVIRYWSGMPNREGHGLSVELDCESEGLLLATGHPLCTDRSSSASQLTEGHFPPLQESRGPGALVVPICIGERVDGLLYVGTRYPRTFTDLDESILKRLADHAAIALHNARLYTAAEHRRHTAEHLAEVGRLLSECLDALEISHRVVEHVQKLLQARVTALYQLDPTSGMLVVVAARDNFGTAAPLCPSLSPGMGAVGLAVDSRQPVVTADILSDPRITLSAAIRASLEASTVRAVLALPLIRDGRVIGALGIGNEAGRLFDPEDIEWARLFADQASSALANAQLYAEVHAARERLQNLSRQLLEVQEAERRRIAHELHDQAGQLLVSVHLALEAAVTKLPLQFQECFCAVRGHLDEIEAQLRHLSHELRPTILDDLGLLPALQFLADGVAARTGLCISVESTMEGRLPPQVETAIYRIMQEGITNITKHAAATHARLLLRRRAQTLQCLLQDNGIGFDVDRLLHPESARGLGLLGIQERLGALGGTLQITSAPGQGTTLEITVPIEFWDASAETGRLEASANSMATAHLGRTGRGNAA
jgi:signal transduction histidine kinase/CHASE1-domain containing sensor protein